MTAEELSAAAEAANRNPYWLAWEMCGSPNLGLSTPSMSFVFWNNDQWVITRKRLGVPRDYPVDTKDHLETLAATITEHQKSETA